MIQAVLPMIQVDM